MPLRCCPTRVILPLFRFNSTQFIPTQVPAVANKNVPSVPPPEALPEGEDNPYLAKYKTALAKSWKLTSGGKGREIAFLATFLWALDRKSEALAVAESVTGAIPAPPPTPRGGVNYDLWYPAVICHALVAHLAAEGADRSGWKPNLRDGARRADAATLADRSRLAILSNCGLARDNPSYLVEMVNEATQSAGTPVGYETLKWETLGRARAIGHAVLFVELAKGGDKLFKPHEKAAAAALPHVLAKLGERLAKGK